MVDPSSNAHGCSSKTTTLEIEGFSVETGANITTCFLIYLFKEETFQTIANETNVYARQKNRPGSRLDIVSNRQN